MLTTTDSVQRAARAILELINSRPVSPRQDEIEAVIQKIAGEERTIASSKTAVRNGLDEYGPDLTDLDRL